MTLRDVEELCFGILIIVAGIVIVVCVCQAMAEYSARGY